MRLFPYLDYHELMILQKTSLKDVISKNQPKRLDFDNTINLSILIVNLVREGMEDTTMCVQIEVEIRGIRALPIPGIRRMTCRRRSLKNGIPKHERFWV
jgi:hypothetical protein